MGNWKVAAPAPPFLVETHAHAHTVWSYSWSGYAITGSNGAYNHAETWFYEPTLYSSYCSTTPT
jgi:hypothetical protein